MTPRTWPRKTRRRPAESASNSAIAGCQHAVHIGAGLRLRSPSGGRRLREPIIMKGGIAPQVPLQRLARAHRGTAHSRRAPPPAQRRGRHGVFRDGSRSCCGQLGGSPPAKAARTAARSSPAGRAFAQPLVGAHMRQGAAPGQAARSIARHVVRTDPLELAHERMDLRVEAPLVLDVHHRREESSLRQRLAEPAHVRKRVDVHAVVGVTPSGTQLNAVCPGRSSRTAAGLLGAAHARAPETADPAGRTTAASDCLWTRSMQ